MTGIVKRKISKVVVAHFLEATKATLEHLSRWHMKLSETSGESPRDLTTTYGNVRRIRDYLHRCMSAYSDTVDWDMTIDDDNLLVACAAHALREIDARLSAEDSSLTPQQRNWLEEKQKILVHWSVQLATHSVTDLPAPKSGTLQAAAVQELQTKVGIKLGNPKKKNDKKLSLVKPFADAPEPQDEESEDAGKDQQDPGLLDVRSVQEPRLRAFLALDLAAYRRAVEARDHRLTIVHLSSILEGVLIDYILPRRKELNITGTPDSWNLQEFVLKRLADQLTSRDRGMLYQVFNAAKLIRPINQYMAPMVVTPSTMQQHLEFVKKVLQELGYSGASRADTPAQGSGFGEMLSPKGPMP